MFVEKISKYCQKVPKCKQSSGSAPVFKTPQTSDQNPGSRSTPTIGTYQPDFLNNGVLSPRERYHCQQKTIHTHKLGDWLRKQKVRCMLHPTTNTPKNYTIATFSRLCTSPFAFSKGGCLPSPQGCQRRKTSPDSAAPRGRPSHCCFLAVRPVARAPRAPTRPWNPTARRGASWDAPLRTPVCPVVA